MGDGQPIEVFIHLNGYYRRKAVLQLFFTKIKFYEENFTK